MSNLSFKRRDIPTGQYWRVLWRDRVAGLIVPTGTEGEMMMLKRTDDAVTELGRAQGLAAAKEFFLAKEREAGKC